MNEDDKIVQIIPAIGWRVLYAEDDGTGYYVDLVCWALVENGNIEPIDTDSTGYVDYLCRESLNFVGIYGPSETHTHEETKRLITSWRTRQEMLQKKRAAVKG